MDVNGDVRPSVGPSALPERNKPMLLLVHGYNNDSAEAAESYFAMRRNLDALLRVHGVAESVRKALQGRIWEFYWPGYLPIGHWSLSGVTRPTFEKVISAPSYALEVIKARDWIADGLAVFLRSVEPSEIFFIGHSLGCRVVLETIARLADPHTIALTGFILMAGAVPIHLLLSNSRLCNGAALVKKRFCLYSGIDLVLWFAFPPGQVLADEVPPYGIPIATGLWGSPSALYDIRSNTWLGHGDYWTQGPFKGGGSYQQLLAGELGAYQPERFVRAEKIASRELKQLKASRNRQIGSRAYTGIDWLRDSYAQ
jgi:pimeloyl-ACP methyl ester carboxylesterase